MSAPGARSRGCIMVAHGDRYRALARLCARYFRATNPGIPVRLYSDAVVEDGLFDEVVPMERAWLGSKMEAMLDSPFDETLYLDVDALALLDIRDGFDILDAYDVALCHDQWRNDPKAVVECTRFLPNAFPQFNGGLLFFRRTPDVRAFLHAWLSTIRETEARKDQPALREILYGTDLRVAVLPPEYNIGHRGAFVINRSFTAPRVLHAWQFHADPRFVACPYPVLRFLGPRAYLALLKAVRKDHYVVRSGAMPAYATFGRERGDAAVLVTLKRVHMLMTWQAAGRSFPHRLLPSDMNLI
jgi:hypothetical protein